MGFVYHANYLIWLDMARTEHLRQAGYTYKQMEDDGVFLAVTEVRLRYRQAARYDDLVRIRCWVRDLASRRVSFGYAVDHADRGDLLATGETTLMALDRRHAVSRIPEHVIARLAPIADPIRL